MFVIAQNRQNCRWHSLTVASNKCAEWSSGNIRTWIFIFIKIRTVFGGSWVWCNWNSVMPQGTKQTVSQDMTGLFWQWPAQEQDNQGRDFVQIRRNFTQRVETMLLWFTNIENLRYIVTRGNDLVGLLWCCVHVGNIASRHGGLRKVGCVFCGQS
jgi:hypothetical protein